MPQLKNQKPHGLGLVPGNQGKPRKARVTSVSLDDFIGWICDGNCRRVIGLPPGSRVIGAQYDLMTNSLYLAIENESFPEIVPGQAALPHLDLIFEDCSKADETD